MDKKLYSQEELDFELRRKCRDCNRCNSEHETWCSITIVLAIIALFGVIFSVFGAVAMQEKADLGGAICEVQQNSTYDYYEAGVLHCKEEKVTAYDGIFIARDDGKSEECWCCAVFRGILVTSLVAGILFCIVFTCFTWGNTTELGDAICKERYNATFDSYEFGYLSCEYMEEGHDGLKSYVTHNNEDWWI